MKISIDVIGFKPDCVVSLMGENSDIIKALKIPIATNYMRTGSDGRIYSIFDCKIREGIKEEVVVPLKNALIWKLAQ